MATFHIEHFGCRATQADAAAIERQLLARGYTRAQQAQAADVVVVNTCTVTQDADAVARQAIRRFHRENPRTRIMVAGCYAQRAPEELAELEGVAWVVGNSHAPEIPDLVAQACPAVAQAFLPVGANGLVHIGNSPPRMAAPFVAQAFLPVEMSDAVSVGDSQPGMAGPHDATRPVLKIQDGCNHRCAYCVIPLVRGRSRSLPPAQVVEEIHRLVTAGAKEVVLSGINLGSYGRDLVPRAEFGELLGRILDETPLERLRVSSIEPMDVTADLVERFAASPRIARHFHIPLQSGSDRILAAMHRWYRAEHYARRVELVRERLPEAAIGADVITGFPGETDADHCATLELAERLPFTYLHVFAFSKRPGTEAARLIEQGRVAEVPPQVIKQRGRELRALGARKNAAFRAAQIGRTLRVLTLARRGDGWTEALSDNYLKVRVAGAFPANTMLEVRITADAGSHLMGRVTPQV
jgi:threonylcarbamoyladenosine tRNA methylthiotransferase MtaB